MNKNLILILAIFLPGYSWANNQNELPPFDYINIVSYWSSYPNIYLDELGNIRIRKYCDKPKLIDKRIDKSVFNGAAQSLLRMKFFHISNNAGLEYSEEKGRIYPIHRECDHCSELYVTFKYGEYFNSSKFEKIDDQATIQNFNNVVEILDEILEPFDGVVCRKER